MNFKRKYSHIESFKVTVNGEYSPNIPHQILRGFSFCKFVLLNFGG
jgi:hypothetical protein